MKGFTLIELIVVISITAVLSVIGIASFVNYSRAQTLNATIRDISAMLQVAKSRAQTQVKGSGLCKVPILKGYRVEISTSQKTYKLYVVCGSTTTDPVVSYQKTLPATISFDASDTSATNLVEFAAVSGAVTGNGNIKIINENNESKIVEIDTVGNISIQ